MLELTGKCCNAVEAVEFFESLAEIVPEDDRTDDFCEQYQDALNRFRYEAAKDIGLKPKYHKGKSVKDWWTCGKCGVTIFDGVTSNYCMNCGCRIKWNNPRCLTGF